MEGIGLPSAVCSFGVPGLPSIDSPALAMLRTAGDAGTLNVDVESPACRFTASPALDRDATGEGGGIEMLSIESLEAWLTDRLLASLLVADPPTVCRRRLYRPLTPLLTISFAPPRPPSPSKSWNEVNVSERDAEVWISSKACARTSLSTPGREDIEASEPLRDLPLKNGKKVVGEPFSRGAMSDGYLNS